MTAVRLVVAVVCLVYAALRGVDEDENGSWVDKRVRSGHA